LVSVAVAATVVNTVAAAAALVTAQLQPATAALAVMAGL
jgi:hypothetical protein